MKIEGLLFGIIAAFLLLASIVYWFMSGDWTGATCLFLSFGLAAMIGYYLSFTARRMDARPEDLPDADISDGAGELGFFPPYSWWPIAVAAGFTVVFLGAAFAMYWLAMIGGVLLAITTIGLLFEYYVDKPFSH